jgi:two-component system sensor histidine kinase CpxA
MTDRIERLVTGQQRLLGDVSHELRSPLSRLIVALGLVRQRPLDASVHLDRIGLEAHRLDALIGQLLMLSRIDSGAQGTTRTTVDLANLLQEITGDADFEARAHGRTVTVSRADACTVDGFEELLRSALENVVRNAVRHTREGTSVDVSLRETRRSGRSIALVTVRDRGDGVPESMLMEMFLPFRRVSSEAPPDAEGSGLGLAITERAVTLHGGRVHAANAPDGGLVVEIELPV